MKDNRTNPSNVNTIALPRLRSPEKYITGINIKMANDKVSPMIQWKNNSSLFFLVVNFVTFLLS